MSARRPSKAPFAATLAIVLAAPAARGQFNIPSKKRDAPPSRSKELEKFRDEAQEVLAPFADPRLGQDRSRAAAHWSIVIVAFAGETQEEQAAMGLVKVRTQGGLPEAYAERRDKATVIAYGQYERPDAPDAKADLERVRSMEIEGARPFARALLAPPAPENLAGSLPELDLRNTKRLFGKDNALYTLQVAIYGRADRSRATEQEIADCRRAAEQAAVILRRDGELAFYYHAPERSMVTVGVFGQDDYDPLRRPGIESDELLRARERHPLNLLNGQGIRERVPVRPGEPEAFRLQPSKLVGVPES